LQTIALLHCLLTHPTLVKGADQGENRTAGESPRLINRVLVIAPVNVLVNWQNELAKWVDDRAVPKVRTYVLNDMTGNASSRDKEIKKTWVSKGGILFASGETLRKFLKPLIDKKDKFADRHAAFFSPGPDGKAQFNHMHMHKYPITNPFT
jgi:SNF2 family DNA or RNA helicase